MSTYNSLAVNLDSNLARQTATLTCYSIKALGKWLVNNPKRAAGADDSSQTAPTDKTAGMSYDSAVDRALEGGAWPEGAEALQAIELPPINKQQQTFRRRFRSNVVGVAPNVPSYLAGRPDSMLELTPQPIGKKVLRVGVHVGRTYTVEQHQVLNRGRAIMSAADSLTLEGYSVELWACWRNKGSDCTANIDVLLKPASAPWIASDVAFALANLAFQRRLCWGVAERIDAVAPITGGYGNGTKADHSDFDVFYPFVVDGYKFHTPESALERIQDYTVDQLTPNK